MTVLINARDEPRVVVDVGPLFEGKSLILFYTLIPPVCLVSFVFAFDTQAHSIPLPFF
jgi:hypothetical protein